MDIFLEKSHHIWLQKYPFQLFGSEPFVSDKSLRTARTRLLLASIFDEKKRDFFMDDGGTFEISGDE
jgi:hypothetical protein